MSDNFFEKTTAGIGFLYTVIALAILGAIIIWG
jgi:hypothetical protein